MTENEFLAAWKLVFGYDEVPHVVAIKFKHDCGFGNKRSYLSNLVNTHHLGRDINGDTWYLQKETIDETR